jgi:hypothetical protein
MTMTELTLILFNPTSYGIRLLSIIVLYYGEIKLEAAAAQSVDLHLYLYQTIWKNDNHALCLHAPKHD